ncbi:TPA: TetR/AcrR family transcriptional regulator, partial [Streptococcus agalactiae]|nr:TetR/AcrR family transcriptional regulator [Streptococcus agalactiae]
MVNDTRREKTKRAIEAAMITLLK